MPRLIRVLAAFAIVIAALCILDWLDMVHLVSAAAICLVLDFLASRLIPRSRQTRRIRTGRRETNRRQPLRHGIAGVCLAIGALLLLALIHTVALGVPAVEAAYLDRGRSRLERKADSLEAEGMWLDAANLLAARSEKPASTGWTAALRRRACLDLAQAAASAPNLTTTRQRLVQAGELSLSSDIPVPVVSMLRKAIDTQDELTACRTREEQLANQVNELQSRQAADSDRYTRILEVYYATLLSCGDMTQVKLSVRQELYQQALRLAESNSLDKSLVEARLQTIAKEIVEKTPLSLPNGTRTRFVSMHIGPDPHIVAIDFTVADAGGQHLPGLQSKDISIRSGAIEAEVLGLCAGVLPLKSLSLVVLLDSSDSTQGEPLRAAQHGAKRLLAALPRGTSVKLFSFASTVTALSDWTTDTSELSPSIDSIRSEGQTALLSALDAATRDLQSRDGPRAIVVFTDGRDTASGPDLNTTLSRCQVSQISLSAIGLETIELDAQSLRHAATATGGSFLSADKVEHLATRFEELATRLKEPVYRVTGLVRSENEDPITVAIGGTNRVTFTVDPKQTLQSVSAPAR